MAQWQEEKYSCREQSMLSREKALYSRVGQECAAALRLVISKPL